MINCLTFSKDRACQLELLLRSIEDNFKEVDKITIIYSASSEKYEQGYEILKGEYSKHNWVRESNLVGDIKYQVSLFDHPFSLVLVDDEIVINDFDVLNETIWDREDFHCISLRMHPKVDYTYTADVISPPPHFTMSGNLYLWDWRNQNPIADWGYPSCINSHIYRTDFLKFWVNSISFNSVNNFEGMLNLQRRFFKPLMGCFEQSKTVNISNNLAQNGTNKHGDKQEFSLSNLNEKFLIGKRLSTENFYGMKINIATFALDYSWR